MSTLLALLLTTAALILAFGDGPPPDDADILPHWSERGGSANPLALFCRQLAATRITSYSKLPDEVKKREEGTEYAMRWFVEQNASAFAAFDSLMASDAGTWQWPEGSAVSDVSHNLDSAALVLGLTQMFCMRIHLLCCQGRSQEAARAALSLANFGHRLQGAEGALFHLFTATFAQGEGEAALEEVLVAEGMNADLVRACLHDLVKLDGPAREDYQFAMRADYLYFKNCVGSMSGRQLTSLSSPWRGMSWPGFVLAMVYKRNNTLATRCELDRGVIEGLGRNWNDCLTQARKKQKFVDDFRARRTAAPLFFDANFGGMLLIEAAHFPFEGDLNRVASLMMLHEQRKLILAIRLYEVDHGNLPQRLEELVPAYLPSIPEDVYSGRAMAWNPQSFTVYSVGSNAKDDGGTIKNKKPQYGKDLGLRYWWRKPPPTLAVP
jgi:hypothetical protein